MCINHALQYMADHIILSNVSHVAGGFGLAILLQHYLVKGRTFVPAWVGWILVTFAFTVHMFALMS